MSMYVAKTYRNSKLQILQSRMSSFETSCSPSIASLWELSCIDIETARQDETLCDL